MRACEGVVFISCIQGFVRVHWGFACTWGLVSVWIGVFLGFKVLGFTVSSPGVFRTLQLQC